MTRDPPPPVVRVDTELGPGFVRRGLENLPWDRREYLGEAYAGRPVYGLDVPDPFVVPGDPDFGVSLRVTSNPIPEDVPGTPRQELKRHITLEQKVKACTQWVRLPVYLAALPTPPDNEYHLFSRWTDLAPFNSPLHRASHLTTVFWAGRGARDLHEAGIFHRIGYDDDHLLLPTHKEFYPCVPVCSHNWYIEKKQLAQLRYREIADFLWSFWTTREYPLEHPSRRYPDESDELELFEGYEHKGEAIKLLETYEQKGDTNEFASFEKYLAAENASIKILMARDHLIRRDLLWELHCQGKLKGDLPDPQEYP